MENLILVATYEDIHAKIELWLDAAGYLHLRLQGGNIETHSFTMSKFRDYFPDKEDIDRIRLVENLV